MKLTLLCAGLFLCGVVAGCGSDGSSGTPCGAFCGTLSECGFSLTSGECLPECDSRSQEASSISSACRAAADAIAVCVGGLSCEGLQDWIDEPPGYPCSAEETAAGAACNP